MSAVDKQMSRSAVVSAYEGVGNLEVMEEAVNYNRFLLDIVAANANGSRAVVDFGAGCGTFSLLIRDRGFSVMSIEPDDGLREKLKGLVVCKGIDELSDSSAPYIFSLNVLEHIEDDVAALHLLRKKLRSGGTLLVYVPAFQILYTSMDRKVGHYRRYRRHSLVTRLTETGFEVDVARYVDSLGFVATLIFKVLDTGNGTINRTMLRIYDRLVFPLSRFLDNFLHPVFGKNLLIIARKR